MIAAHKGEIPFVLLLLPFIAGIGCALIFPIFTNSKPVFWTFLFLSGLFIILNAFYQPLHIYKARWVGGLLVFGILYVLGVYSIIQNKEINQSNHFSKTTSQFLLIKISNEPVWRNKILHFTAEVIAGINHNRTKTLSGTLLVAVNDTNAQKLYYGDELLIPARYNPINPPQVPAALNYKGYLANQNIYYQAFFYGKQYTIVQKNKGNALITYALRQRQRLVNKIKNSLKDTDAIAVASTLILGYKADLSKDVLQAYSKTGTIHVLSVSGAHVAIIYVLLAFLLGFLDKFKHGKIIKAVLIILIIWYYSLLSGFSPAVCRAAVMISMVIIGKTFNRYINTLNILAVSAFILLLYNPLLITDVGFQLSYLAVFGLVVLQPVVYKLFTIKNKLGDKLWALCAVSIAAQLITFPLSAYYFHQFPVYFLISNLFIMIPSAIIMYAGLLFLLMPKIPFISSGLAFLLEKSILLMNKGLQIIEHSPYASFNKIWISVPECILMMVIITCIFYFLFKPSYKVAIASLCFTLVLCISLSLKSIGLSTSNQMVWLSINKHSGIVCRKGNSALVITDLQPIETAYQYNIQPYLDSCGVKNQSIINFNTDYQSNWVIKKQSIIQFLNNRALLLDGKSKSNFDLETLQPQFFYLANSPYPIFWQINHNLSDKIFIIDGTNSDRFISNFKQLAKQNKIKYLLLKRNKSYLTSS